LKNVSEMKICIYGILIVFLLSCEESVNHRRVAKAEEFIKTFYTNDSYEFREVFDYLSMSKSEFDEMSILKQNEFKDHTNKSFSEFHEFLNESEAGYDVVSYKNLDQSLLKEYNLPKSLFNDDIVFLVNEHKIISFFLYDEALKINYLGASPRDILRKTLYNFEASLGVLKPLAVPIKSFSPDPWLSKHKREITPLYINQFVKSNFSKKHSLKCFITPMEMFGLKLSFFNKNTLFSDSI